MYPHEHVAGRAMLLSSFCVCLMWGGCVMTMAMKQISASRITSLKTVPVELSSSYSSSPDTGFAHLDDGYGQVDSPGGERSLIDDQLKVKNRTDKCNVERDGQTLDQLGEHRANRLRSADRLRDRPRKAPR